MKLYKELEQYLLPPEYRPATIEDIRKAAAAMGYVVVPEEPPKSKLGDSDMGRDIWCDWWRTMIAAAKEEE